MSDHEPDPIAVVRALLDRLAEQDAEAAVELLDVDVEWRNSGLPTLHGRRVADALRGMVRRGVGFEVVMHHVAADGDAVLTDRTDTLIVGGVRSTFTVNGTFVVRHGKVALWDDRFSWLGAGRSTLLGLAGAARAAVAGGRRS